MTWLGICVGASTLSTVEITCESEQRPSVSRVHTEPHHGNPQDLFMRTMEGIEPDRYAGIALTGRSFRHNVNLSSISEPEAVEEALHYVNTQNRPVEAVVSAGGETFILYVLAKDGRISSIQAGNKCASGTGEFFLQQIRRMGLSLDEAVAMAAREDPYRVSGRCSVFCKSDCTHALNKGIPKGRVAGGLCRMMAAKVLEIIKQVPKRDIMIVGGCAKNSVMIDCLKEEIENLLIPEEAPYFEALGAALWASAHTTLPFPSHAHLLNGKGSLFYRLPPLAEAESMVEFRESSRGQAQPDDRCILGLDVGSTTTKAVLVRAADDKVLASVYLRTEGDPVGASRRCYGAIAGELGDLTDRMDIVGLGVTGSGRQIAGLHAMTEGVINEIIAHATGALHFDGEVDTIFEIGGQDAKYTSITNGVASDYAMNEACSAGTGSFLEEAAHETLGVEMEKIADYALQGTSPPNFNDQCAAFIGSDIKNAVNEGIDRDDILAGLVYSICMNYNNRVRGNRPAGRKVFMQGGVCYNRAVPLAMAALTGKPIVVPPDPGLIGALGVALEIKRRMTLGFMKEQSFSLKALRDRAIDYGKPFICDGGKEKCDRKCEIARIKIEGKTYPFGGACNRWYNLRSNVRVDADALNRVGHFEKFVFDTDMSTQLNATAPTIGINKSFYVNTYFPLYFHFFTHLGFRVIRATEAREEGMDRKTAPFCYPAEIAHGYFFDLLECNPDWLFLPMVQADFVQDGLEEGINCPLSQGEPFYLAAAFKDHQVYKKLSTEGKILDPLIDFSAGIENAESTFISIARTLGKGRKEGRSAFRHALSIQKEIFRTMEEEGRECISRLEAHPDDFAVVIFGRSYNAFVSEANMGIPNKFASRGIDVIPLPYLPMTEPVGDDDMYWSAGQRILKGARFVAKHRQLFGCYITNFSCGPDSFLVGYFRDVMGKKPSLTLELDSHVADAGLETRIEAFLDIVRRYRELEGRVQDATPGESFTPAMVTGDHGQLRFVDSQGQAYSLSDDSVHVLFPSMSRFISEIGAAAFRGFGMHSSALPPADDEVLKLGRGHTSCKECLPLLLTTGGLLHYLDTRGDINEKLIYFMPTASGPCRFGQYSRFLSGLVTKLRVEDVALFSLSAENSYADFGGNGLAAALWQGVILADIFEEIYSVLLTNAVDTGYAMGVFEECWRTVITSMENPAERTRLPQILELIAARLRNIPVVRSLQDTPVILLAGEIYVRHDNLSRQYLVEELAARGFATKVASLAEWIYYTGWCVRRGVATGTHGLREQLALRFRTIFMKKQEKNIRRALSASGLCSAACEDVDHVLSHTTHLMKPELVGEAILTIGTSINEVLDRYCGVIAIGPFGCMPNRLAEAVLSREMNREGKLAAGANEAIRKTLEDTIENLPFMAIESDGNRFPQIITARLEAFTLQASRIHHLMGN